MRLGLMAEMSEAVRRPLFAGAFPVYCYMYLIRQFMRMNGVKAEQVQEFILHRTHQRGRRRRAQGRHPGQERRPQAESGAVSSEVRRGSEACRDRTAEGLGRNRQRLVQGEGH